MTDNTPGRLCFETDALPERDRFPAFCEGIFRHVVGADVARLGSLPFHGSLSVRLIGGVRIADIALESGFADLSQFNRAFRRRFGDTPSGMRAEARRSSDES